MLRVTLLEHTLHLHIPFERNRIMDLALANTKKRMIEYNPSRRDNSVESLRLSPYMPQM